MTDSGTPETLLEAVAHFAQPGVAHDFMVQLRWADGVVKCPRCQSEKVCAIPTRKTWECKCCTEKKQFSVKTGTIFEESPLGLDKWMAAIWMIANCKNGVSSHELGRSLGITQKSAWFMLGRIRLAMQTGSFEQFNGEVEADETFVGPRAKNMHRHKWAEFKNTDRAHMVAVAGVLERTAEGKPSRVRLKVVKNTSRTELQGYVREHVAPGAMLSTDALLSYEGLNDAYVHGIVDHAVAYVDQRVHTNGLENFWSLLKRTLKGTYVAIEPVHLHRYLDEQMFRFNNRWDGDAARFVMLLKSAVGRRLTYAELTGRPGTIPRPP